MASLGPKLSNGGVEQGTRATGTVALAPFRPHGAARMRATPRNGASELTERDFALLTLGRFL